MMQKVSHGKTKMNKMVRRRELPCVHGSCIEGESFVVRCQSRWKEKSDEEAKKKQRKGLRGKGDSCSQKRSWNVWLAGITRVDFLAGL
jgi:hypothetical protein